MKLATASLYASGTLAPQPLAALQFSPGGSGMLVSTFISYFLLYIHRSTRISGLFSRGALFEYTAFCLNPSLAPPYHALRTSYNPRSPFILYWLTLNVEP